MTFLCGRLGGCGIIASERFFLSKFFRDQILLSKRNKKTYHYILTRPRLKLPILEISEKGAGRGHETVSQKKLALSLFGLNSRFVLKMIT